MGQSPCGVDSDIVFQRGKIPMARVSLKGVVVGGVVDIVGTFILSLPLMSVAMVQLRMTGLPEPERTAALMRAMGPGTSYYLVGMVAGVSCSVLGGFVAARIAGHDERLNGALSAWLCMLSGIYGWATGAIAASAFAHLGYLLLSPAVGAFGGYLCERVRSKGPGDRLTSAPA